MEETSTTIYMIMEMIMENDWKIPFSQRLRERYNKQLEEALTQYSVVKVADAKGAHHGKDYEEMKRVILDLLTGE